MSPSPAVVAEWVHRLGRWVAPLDKAAVDKLPPSDQLAYAVLMCGRVLVLLAVAFAAWLVVALVCGFVSSWFREEQQPPPPENIP